MIISISGFISGLKRAAGAIGSVGFGTASLLVLVELMCFGTCVEFMLGGAAARSLVYGSWWFIGLIGVICLSLLASIGTRFPWKSEHCGFVTVHLSLVCLLIAGLVSYHSRVEADIEFVDGVYVRSMSDEVVPFHLELVGHHRIDYPGTSKAQSYETDVVLMDVRGERSMHTVSLVGAIGFEGWKIYLRLEDDEDSVSFHIVHDPGLIWMYIGSTGLCAGLLVMLVAGGKVYPRHGAKESIQDSRTSKPSWEAGQS